MSQNDVVIILAIQWSDDFDPNSSIKCNRGSVWIKTVSFLTEDNDIKDITNTYVISIGDKGSNHDAIETLYLKELKDLCNGINNVFFSKNASKEVKVHLEIIASLGDQPERRNINYLMNGNSTFGKRYG